MQIAWLLYINGGPGLAAFYHFPAIVPAAPGFAPLRCSALLHTAPAHPAALQLLVIYQALLYYAFHLYYTP